MNTTNINNHFGSNVAINDETTNPDEKGKIALDALAVAPGVVDLTTLDITPPTQAEAITTKNYSLLFAMLIATNTNFEASARETITQWVDRFLPVYNAFKAFFSAQKAERKAAKERGGKVPKPTPLVFMHKGVKHSCTGLHAVLITAGFDPGTLRKQISRYKLTILKLDPDYIYVAGKKKRSKKSRSGSSAPLKLSEETVSNTPWLDTKSADLQEQLAHFQSWTTLDRFSGGEFNKHKRDAYLSLARSIADSFCDKYTLRFSILKSDGTAE